MSKSSIWIVITYIIMQFSGIFGILLVLPFINKNGASIAEISSKAAGYWGVISFFIALIVILLIQRKGKNDLDMRGEKLNVPNSVAWAIGGFFLALFAQGIAGIIESAIGIPTGSENTEDLLNVAKYAPIFIAVISVFAPILEEIVFRQVIFGGLYKKYNYFLSALISSLIFAVVHMDFSHLLIYAAMGFTFSFLYVKTKRIIVPIFAHMAMNSYVVVMQFFFADEIQKMIQENATIFFFLN